MSLSMEARHLVVQHASRRDVCALARVCKDFQVVAERSLYNTLYLSGINATMSLCNVLAGQPRVAAYVETLTIAVMDDETTGEEEISPHFPEYWRSVGAGLRSAHRLLHLTIQVDFIGNSHHAWILDGCQFRLRTFHCDLAWDDHLVGFLNDQDELEDLYILDFPYPADADIQVTPAEPQRPLFPPPPPVRRVVSPVPGANSLPKLSILECPTTDAVSVLVPRRPITRVKTCFATSEVEKKRRELTALFVNLRLSTRPLLSLDLGDSSYSADCSLNFLRHCVSANRTMDKIRYLGTLALPVDGRERLRFYGLLRGLPCIECVEVEVTDWDPPPMSFLALRAITNELRLYCRTVKKIVFVYDFDRVVITVLDDGAGGYVLEEEHGGAADVIWREV
ncbi:hypothetical protein BDM02DRAFT_3186321 [Thelephora ganbajun]|uniref:Uncharacterized protein n=1 Tax=Thelephora ganbajun TaxID=370292 RepID=A0ACB6ZJ01_THEGA|nr:hypothetical protein BDM02DRAFT_3186321 [Thelephora ganbajun]